MPSSILTSLSSSSAAAVLASTRAERVALAAHAVESDRAEVRRLEVLTHLDPADTLAEFALEAARDALHYAEEALANLS